jgi:predicted nucleotidyltransferase
MLEALFSSKTRVRMLALLILGGGEPLHTRLISQKINAPYSQTWRELERLEKAGLLNSNTIGRLRFFQVNPKCAILPDLRTLLLKADGFGEEVRKALRGIPINAAFIYGSMASNQADLSSDIDLMIIGDASLEDLSNVIYKLEKKLSRAINYSIFPLKEWQERIRKGDAFLKNVKAGPKIWIIGGDNDLG